MFAWLLLGCSFTDPSLLVRVEANEQPATNKEAGKNRLGKQGKGTNKGTERQGLNDRNKRLNEIKRPKEWIIENIDLFERHGFRSKLEAYDA